MAVKDILQSFLLTELFKGLALTGRHFLSRTITVQFPEEKRRCRRGFEGCMH